MKIPREAVAPDDWRALDTGAVWALRTGVARFRLTGPGRVACLHGLVTCDVARAAEPSLLFGALLTPKGMIVAPAWITRQPDALDVEVPGDAAAAVREIFDRSLPPRLCRAEEQTPAVASFGVYGPRAAEVAPAAALPAVARGAPGREWTVPAPLAAETGAALTAAGVRPAPDALLDAARILAGIPRLGSEIGEKTLPQEVRLDAIGAVSFTKGCYVGQETVARLHFRGRTTRALALLLPDKDPVVPDDVRAGEKLLGRLTSAAWSPDLDAWVGQAVLRHEAADGDEVTLAAGGTAVVRRERWPRDP